MGSVTFFRGTVKSVLDLSISSSAVSISCWSTLGLGCNTDQGMRSCTFLNNEVYITSLQECLLFLYTNDRQEYAQSAVTTVYKPTLVDVFG